jgi:hypothetical protein
VNVYIIAYIKEKNKFFSIYREKMSHNSKYIISEFYDFKADRNLIIEAEQANKPIKLKGILQKANTQNRNGRVYPFDILKREADNYMQSVKERRALGECDHPESPIVSLSNASHLVTNMWWEGETLMGEVELVETEAGNKLKGLLKSGVMLGISSRGVGSVKSVSGRDVVQSDFELIAFDFVSSPSTPGAYMFKESRQWGLKKLEDVSYKSKNIDTNNNDSHSKIITLSNDNYWNL